MDEIKKRKTGVYSYSIRKFNGTFEQYKMPVEIIDEHETTYYIKFLHVHADGRGFGSKSWVKKIHVYTLEGASSIEKLQTSKSYKHIYKPYKD
jgi:hypothetical protein